MASDYKKSNIDLTALLPVYLRNDLNTSLFENLFNRFFTKQESLPFYGYVGNKISPSEEARPLINQSTVERTVNTLTPSISFSVGPDRHIFTFQDILNRATSLGIDISKLKEWGKSQTLNFAPPIDLDKFCNYTNYYWIADGINHPEMTWNTSNIPEYVTISKPENNDRTKLSVDIATTAPIVLTGSGRPVNETFTITATSPTTFDVSSSVTGTVIGTAIVGTPFVASGVISFLISEGTTPFVSGDVFTITITQIVNSYTAASTGVGNGTITGIKGLAPFQTIDGITLKINQRILVKNQLGGVGNGIYVVQNGAFTRALDFNSDADLISGAYVYVLTGTVNAQTAFSTPETPQSLAALTFSADSTVSKLNDWSQHNYWVHTDDLGSVPNLDLSKVQFARRPIVEFQYGIELSSDSLDGIPQPYGSQSFNSIQQKTKINQNPLFNLYDLNGEFTNIISPIFYYAENQQADYDELLNKRPARDENSNLIFSQGLLTSDGAQLFYKISSASNQLKSIWQPGPTSATVSTPIITSDSDATIADLTPGELTNSQKFILTALTSSTFSVVGSEDGSLPNLIVGVPYSEPAFGMTVAPGSIPFLPGDTISFILTNVEVPKYVELDSTGSVVPYFGDPNSVDGAWATPKAIRANLLHENRREIGVQELVFHFRNIISSQHDFSGSPTGFNNWRNISKNYGLGGVIKDFSNSYGLFISMLMQRDLSPLSILDFAESSYQQALNSVTSFFDQDILKFITEQGNPTPASTDISLLDPTDLTTQKLLKAYEDSIKDRTDLSQVFYDSTSAIKNWPATLPYLGLAPAVEPKYVFDSELGIVVLKHHDGHATPVINIDVEVNRVLSRAQVSRWNNQLVAGISRPTAPTRTSDADPLLYKNQLWFDSSTGDLYIFGVASDTTSPAIAFVNDLWYSSETQTLKRWDGSNWQPEVLTAAWQQVDLTAAVNSLVFAVETKLYENVPANTQQVWPPNNTISTSQTYQKNLELEFARFAAKYEYDPAGTDYDSTDAFTWNYKQLAKSAVTATSITLSLTTGTTVGIARWHDLLKEHFDGLSLSPVPVGSIGFSLPTCRPNLEPWKIVGFETKPVAWDSGMGTGDDFYTGISPTSELAPAKVVQVTNLNLNAAPNTVDGVSLAAGDRVLVIGQTLQEENGLYTVSFLGSGSNGIWIRATDMLGMSTMSTGAGLAISEGYEFLNTVWVLTTTGTVGTDAATFVQSRLWSSEMWNWIASILPPGPGLSQALSVNPRTDELLPPYVAPGSFASSFAITNVEPADKNTGYIFGDNGPAELVWRKSVEYAYGFNRAGFKVEPIVYLNRCWGFCTQHLNNDLTDIELIRSTGTRPAANKFLYHGEKPAAINRDVSKLVVGTFNSTSPSTIKLQVTTQLSGLTSFPTVAPGACLQLTVNDIKIGNLFANTLYSGALIGVPSLLSIIDLKISDQGRGFSLGDQLIITVDGSNKTVQFIPASVEKFAGLNQYYTNLLRYNSIDIYTTFNAKAYRGWSTKLAHRANGFLRTDNLNVSTNLNELYGTAAEAVIKINPLVKSIWAEALRIELTTTGQRKYNTAGAIIPAGAGEDWQFRIETYNTRRPEITYYDLDTSAEYVTFFALNKEKTDNEWRSYVNILSTPSNPTGLITRPVPFAITGVQNVINFLIGYTLYLEAQGWRFNKQDKPSIDEITGRAISWQLEIEKFISDVWSGIEVGQASILNPFVEKIWIETPNGLVSSFDSKAFIDINAIPAAYDLENSIISTDDLTIIRKDRLTSISSTVPLFSVHGLIEEYEHVIVFENYANGELIYDSYLGSQISRIYFNGEKQTNLSLRPSFGGYILSGNKLIKNLESHVAGFKSHYDANLISDDNLTSPHALALLGYSKKDYFKNLNTSDRSQFNFWRGLIQEKGTNNAISAFFNSSKFKEFDLDEFWAYKIAEYGDSRTKNFPEMKIQPSDAEFQHSRFVFESEDASITAAITTSEPSFTLLEPLDEDRWFSLDDLGQTQYFVAEKTNSIQITGAVDQIIPVNLKTPQLFILPNITQTLANTSSGSLIVEPIKLKTINSVEDWEFLATSATEFTVSVNGSLVGSSITINQTVNVAGLTFKIGSGLTEFSAGDKFNFSIEVSKLSGSSVKLLAPITTSSAVSLFGFINSSPKFNPMKLFNYQAKVLVDDVPIWNPAAGIHEPTALAEIDFTDSFDPARYTYSTLELGNLNLSPLKSWGPAQVGKIWWDTSNLAYMPYDDELIFPSTEERLARWGAPAAWSTVDVYEWVESTVPPNEYDALSLKEEGNTEIDPAIRASGQAARPETYFRNRTWYGRPIAWSYNQVPASYPFVSSSFSSDIYFQSTEIGPSNIILATGRFSDYDITPGMKLSAWTKLYENVAHEVKEKPVGEVMLGTSLGTIIGSSESYGPSWNRFTDARIISNTSTFEANILITKSSINPIISFIGPIILTATGADQLTATAAYIGESQTITITDIQQPAGYVAAYDFSTLGIKLELTTAVDSLTSVISAATILNTLAQLTHDIFVRETISATVELTIPDNHLSNDDDMIEYGWKAWTVPTQAQLDSDLLSPNNSWVPYYGDYQQITPITGDRVSLIQDYTNNKLMLKDLTAVEKYTSTWGAWQLLDKTIVKQYSTGTSFVSSQIDFTLEPKRVSIYRNGALISGKNFTINENTVELPSTAIGDEIVIIQRAYSPTAAELAFDPEAQDDVTVQTQYKRDYRYVSVQARDSGGNLNISKYYFWVKNKNTAGTGKKTSVQQLKNKLRFGPSLYATFQSFQSPAYLGLTNSILPARYQAFTVYGLNSIVTQNNMYKLRFTKNFTLRDDPNQLQLKNTHSEWILLRKSHPLRIPEDLWLKLTHSLAAEDFAGNPIPSDKRKQYDARHGTSTRFGLKEGQTLAPRNLLIDVITYTILNTQLTITAADGSKLPDTLNGIIDFEDYNSWFATAESTQDTMSKIWEMGSPRQVNEIFFAALNEALVNNFELADIFKTSRIMIYAVRQITPFTQG
jgi:hypothetical protein